MVSEKDMIIVNTEEKFTEYIDGKKKNPDNKIVILRKEANRMNDWKQEIAETVEEFYPYMKGLRFNILHIINLTEQRLKKGGEQ